MGLLKLAKELEVLAYELDVFGVQKDAAGFATNNRGRKLYDTKGFKAGEKDLWRMRDMKVRAQGDDKKLVALARQMANSIRSEEKAMRRADAAAQIFKDSPVKDDIVKAFMDAGMENYLGKSAATPKLEETVNSMMSDTAFLKAVPSMIDAARSGIQVGRAEGKPGMVKFNTAAIAYLEAIHKKDAASALKAAESLVKEGHGEAFGLKAAATPKLYEYEYDGMKFYTDKRMPQGIRLPAGKAKFTKSYFTVSGALGKEIAENKEAGKKELTTPEKHQLKILIDTVKNPDKGLLSGPDADEAKRILKEKYHYTDKQISDLEKM